MYIEKKNIQYVVKNLLDKSNIHSILIGMEQRAHKIKLIPTESQEKLLWQAAGTARYTYNWALNRQKELHDVGEPCSVFDVMRTWTQERPVWTQTVSSTAQQRAISNADTALKNFFKGNADYPVHHKKYHHDSFYISNQAGKIGSSNTKTVYLPKIGYIRMRQELRYERGKIMSYTVSHEADGWYVSIQVELEVEPRTESTSVVGVDVGCSTFAVASDGTTCEKPKQLKALENKLKAKQRSASKKQKHSQNRRKARRKVARLYQHIKRVKLDAAHKFTAKVAKNHGTIVVETLDIKSMQTSKNKYVRKGVHNSLMREIIRQLEYKCNHVIHVDKMFPSSKTCSACGHIKADLKLSDRTYHCPSCGHTIDRDLNAAINLRDEGIRLSTVGHTGNACGETDEQLELAL